MPFVRDAVWWRRPSSGALSIATSLGWRGTVLAADRLIERAREKTGGLDDFGGDDFIEPLALLLREFASHARADALGNAAFALTLRRSLENRLRLRQALRDYPALAAQRVDAPLVVVGLPRTGTTLLQGLLSEVRELRPLLRWETNVAALPLALASEEERNAQRRLSRYQVAGIYRFSPDMVRAHELGAVLPEECNPLLMTSFRANIYCMLFRCPEYLEYVHRTQFAHAYDWHQLHLQWLAYEAPPATWLLKGPAHLGSLPALLRAYPAARVVFVHRNPLECVPSMMSLTSCMRMLLSPVQDRAAIGQDVLAMLDRAQQAGFATRDQWPSTAPAFIDVRYDDLVAAPVTTVRNILAHFDLPVDENLDSRLDAYLRENRQHRRGAHRYDLAAFSLRESAVREVFQREFDLLAIA